MIALSIAVQHHPLRAHLLQPLMDRIGGFELVSDPDPEGERNPMRTYLECLRRAPEDATHRCVLQDDTWPCSNFREKAELALAERPGTLVCFFIPGAGGGGRTRVLRAAKAGERWALIGLGGWISAVATCWPRELALEFVDFIDHARRVTRADDGMITTFAKRRRLEVWATVPSLVEHPDREPSLLGKRAHAGANRARVAGLLDGS